MVGLPMQLIPLLLVVPFARSLRRDNSGEAGVLSVSVSDNLCTKGVVDEARKMLGEETRENLMAAIDLEESELDEMLAALGVKSVSLGTLCASAVSHIKDILHKDIPLHSDEACIDANCSSTMNVSEAKMAEEDAKIDFNDVNLGNDLVRIDGNDTVDEGPYKPGVEQMLRRLLAILFHVYPQIDIGMLETEDNASASSSLSESSQRPSMDGSFSASHQQTLQKAYQGASGHVSAAIRKMSGNVGSVVQEYFKTSSSGFTGQLKRHLSLMLDSFSRAYAKDPGMYGPCGQGASAYVKARVYCRFNSECGTKTGGKYEVNYCHTFFKAHFSYIAAHTVIHEHSHHFGTDDKKYHKPAIFSLSASDMQKNADNYAHFAVDVVKKGGGGGYPAPRPSPPTYGGWPSPSPPTYGGYPRPSPPTYGGYPRPSPPTYGGWPSPSPPTYGGWPSPSPPTYGGWPSPSPPSYSGGYPRPSPPPYGGRTAGWPSPPPPPPPAPAPAGGNCFPPDAQVRLESQEHQKSIASLAPGDALYDEAGRKNEYLFDFHEDDVGRVGAMVSYLRIEHSLQKEGRPLFITRDHLLFACTDETNCEKEVMPAGELAAGTHFLFALSSKSGALVPSKVTSVEVVVRRGFAGPFSSSGTLIVEGVLASSYALLSDRQVSLWKRGPAWLRRNTQNIAHLVSLPLRWARLLGGAKAYITSISGMFDQLSDAVLQVTGSAVQRQCSRMP